MTRPSDCERCVAGSGASRTSTEFGPKSLHRVQKEHIGKALTRTGGNIAKSAALLGITVRELRRLMRELQIETPKNCSGGEQSGDDRAR